MAGENLKNVKLSIFRGFFGIVLYMNEIIYVLINEAMPGYVKIGRTGTELEQRVRELSGSTSIPLPFTVFHASIVRNAKFVEEQLHNAFDNDRINPRREFFTIDPERVVAALKLAEIEDITPNKDIVDSTEDQRALNQARERLSRFNFKLAQIPAGSEIQFLQDETIKAIVADDHKHIKWNGEVTSVSDAAWKILKYKYRPQGTRYWLFEGETLDARRRRIEFGDDE